MYHRKCEHPSNIVCKYILTNTCRKSSNQGALSWFRRYQLPLSAPNVANAAPGVATSVSPVWNKKIPSSQQEPEPYVRTTATNGDHDATAGTKLIPNTRFSNHQFENIALYLIYPK